VHEDKVAAKFKNGELTVTLPKTKEVIPEGRQIKIS
jgi:HSP20 family molecular chaperone IbpA